MPKIGLVTVLYKCDDVLEDFFKSLSLQTYKDYFLYIFDNSPSIETDACVLRLSKQFPIPGLIHIKSTSNVGIAKGNNTGIQMALENNCDYVLLLNNDITFYEPDFFKSMVEIAETKAE